ncbi:hypothetical protein PSCICF_29880 [Pseudomonas cichorii]|nr:hypothetical protein [Pseudomonas cichorii]GFM56810.1 hypothetical protein PSCICF_29880 [Pseudomonas cichorii]GFM62346.1 hypothetical protein PSCICG_35060 [Pseudomonas cichorii]
MVGRNRTLWGDLKFIVLAIIFLLIAVPGSFAVYRLFWTDATLCLAEGKVLSYEEHRQRFLESLVRQGVENSYIYKRRDGKTNLKTGIIDDGKNYDLIRMVHFLKGNGKSFEENFGIRVVAPLEGEPKVETPREPFVLVTYYDGQSGSSTLIDSKDVKPVKDISELSERLSVYERLRGYGGRFYEVAFSMLSVECCGNDRYGRTYEEYKLRKSLSYQYTLDSIAEGNKTRTAVAASSSCGEVLTEKNDNGFSTRSIKWVIVRDKS